MSKKLTALIIVAILGLGLAPANTSTNTATNSPELSGTIRHSTSGWYVINDAGHQPTGFGTIETLPDRVRIWYAAPVLKVGSVQVTPDESFTAAGVRVGASVGLERMDVFFYMGTSQTPVNPALLTRANANVWVTGWFD